MLTVTKVLNTSSENQETLQLDNEDFDELNKDSYKKEKILINTKNYKKIQKISRKHLDTKLDLKSPADARNVQYFD